MLQIKNLHVNVDNKKILDDINLDFYSGSTTYLLGPNGAGKSSFAMALMAHPKYDVEGEIFLNNKAISDLATYKRARLGLFVSMQYPQDLAGVRVGEFLYESYKALNNLESFSRVDFNTEFDKACLLVGFDNDQNRLMEGLSGGQRKRLELVQLYLNKPSCVVLDEIDSGMDQAGVRAISQVLEYCRQQNPALIVIIITHYKDNILFKPDRFLFIKDGQISE